VAAVVRLVMEEVAKMATEVERAMGMEAVMVPAAQEDEVTGAESAVG